MTLGIRWPLAQSNTSKHQVCRLCSSQLPAQPAQGGCAFTDNLIRSLNLYVIRGGRSTLQIPRPCNLVGWGIIFDVRESTETEADGDQTDSEACMLDADPEPCCNVKLSWNPKALPKARCLDFHQDSPKCCYRWCHHEDHNQQGQRAGATALYLQNKHISIAHEKRTHERNLAHSQAILIFS